MQKQISPKILALTFGVIVILFVTAFYISAWTEPLATPPAGNASTSVNISTSTQYKYGAFGVGGIFQANSNLVFLATTTVTGNINFSGATAYKVTNLAEPTANSDAATKGYVDAKLSGGGGGGGGLDFYQTSATYTGSQASTACTAGYHMCLADEQSGRPYNTALGADSNLDTYSWVDINSNTSSGNYGDCLNWTTNLGSRYGGAVALTAYVNEPVWRSSGSAVCNGARPVLCCENMSPQIEASDRTAATFLVAATTCRNLGGNWHLPSIEELAYYVGLAGATGNYLWTSTDGTQSNTYRVIILSTGGVSDGSPTGVSGQSLNYRCVR